MESQPDIKNAFYVKTQFAIKLSERQQFGESSVTSSLPKRDKMSKIRLMSQTLLLPQYFNYRAGESVSISMVFYFWTITLTIIH